MTPPSLPGGGWKTLHATPAMSAETFAIENAKAGRCIVIGILRNDRSVLRGT
jgi:hypothetical protein